MEPLIIFAVMFIGNTINLVIIPILLITTVLGIISNLSDRVQIAKLSEFFKSGIIWILGITITIFVSIASLEGTLTSSVDGLALKGIKSATTTFVPVVGKALGESVDTVLRMCITFKEFNRNIRFNYNNRNMYNANYKAKCNNNYVSFCYSNM